MTPPLPLRNWRHYTQHTREPIYQLNSQHVHIKQDLTQPNPMVGSGLLYAAALQEIPRARSSRPSIKTLVRARTTTDEEDFWHIIAQPVRAYARPEQTFNRNTLLPLHTLPRTCHRTFVVSNDEDCQFPSVCSLLLPSPSTCPQTKAWAPWRVQASATLVHQGPIIRTNSIVRVEYATSMHQTPIPWTNGTL